MGMRNRGGRELVELGMTIMLDVAWSYFQKRVDVHMQKRREVKRVERTTKTGMEYLILAILTHCISNACYEETVSSLMNHPIMPMTYLIPFHLVAGSYPPKPGPTNIVAAFLLSVHAQSKQK